MSDSHTATAVDAEITVRQRRRMLARELGRNLEEGIEAILAKYGFGPPTVDPATQALLDDAEFQDLVRTEHLAWVQSEARIKASRAVRDTVPHIRGLIENEETPPRARVSGMETLAKVAGLDQAERNTGPAVSISINIPTTQEPSRLIEGRAAIVNSPAEDRAF